ncbi:unnamed protein product [Vitrella brassicaformis CCMP3155]|uniref:Uncharacterized protein n=1 Tax=Vitrella brassicaformis (strain CCMP3155) TaxID=1169540 RepID=A0A0G4F0P2_VITBC|nr:unnamed protein product [Vitrella brassicaformis CCMP3155]|eukprot:CEM05293.1 unnamed protein product [Vitrella brassicaformis CCMP3155]
MASSEPQREPSTVSLSEFEELASLWGLQFKWEMTGPFFRVEVRVPDKSGGNKKTVGGFKAPPMMARRRVRGTPRGLVDDENLIGYVDGFLDKVLLDVVHLDKVEIRHPAQQTLSPNAGRWTVGSLYGLGFLLGGYVVLQAHQRGIKKAELLAIYDDPHMHDVLVRLYGRLGYHVVREVGEDLKDIPDRLVWGGIGTRMDADIDSLVRNFTPYARRLIREAKMDRKEEEQLQLDSSS